MSLKSTNKVSDMLKQTLATRFAFFFTSLLLSVTGDEGISTNKNFGNDRLPFFISTFKEKRPQHLNRLSCNWDATRPIESESDSPNVFNIKQVKELSLEKDNSEENSEEDFAVETPFINSEPHLGKRFTVFRRKNPVVRGYKRGPGFRSWGGKRESLQSWQSADKKSKFASWGGKRNEQSFPDDSVLSSSRDANAVDTRPKFQIWGGKRSTNDCLEETEKKEKDIPVPYSQSEKRGLIWKNRGLYMNEPFKKHVPKRPQFQSWGGKRALYPRHRFFGFLHPKSTLLLYGGEKRKFSSWGGKRFDEYENLNEDNRSEENFKRRVFQNWRGRRVAIDTDSVRDNTDIIVNSREKTKESDKRKERTSWDKKESYSKIDSGGDEFREETNKR